MTDDELGLKLRGARERLCVVQTRIRCIGQRQTEQLREKVQTAIDIIDSVGVLVDPSWSVHNEPTIGDPDAD